MCFEGLGSNSRRVFSRFVRGSREISSVSSLYRESTDSLIQIILQTIVLTAIETTFMTSQRTAHRGFLTLGSGFGDQITLNVRMILLSRSTNFNLVNVNVQVERNE